MSETMSISHDYSGEYVEDVLVDSLQGILEVQSQLFPNNLEAGKLESESGEEDFQPLKWKVEVERKRWSNSKILKGGLVHSETNFEETTKIFDREFPNDEPHATLQRSLVNQTLTNENKETVEILTIKSETLEGKSIVMGEIPGQWRLLPSKH